MSIRKAVIIDDRAHAIDWLEDQLTQDLGLDIVRLENEKDAREHFSSIPSIPESTPYALAIVDIMIPVAKLEELVTLDEKYLKDSRSTGVRLCRFLREELGIPQEVLPIIAISARNDEELIQDMQSLGIQLFSRNDLELGDAIENLIQR